MAKQLDWFWRAFAESTSFVRKAHFTVEDLGLQRISLLPTFCPQLDRAFVE